MSNEQNICQRLRKTERLIKRLATKRGHTFPSGAKLNRSRTVKRRTKQRSLILGDRVGVRQRRATSNSSSNFGAAVALHRSKPLTRQAVNRKVKQLFESNVPIRKNISESHEIHPPIQHSGVDEFGEYVEIVGTEAISSLTVRPASAARPTEPGNIIAAFSLAPQELPSTRAYLASKMYEKYLPINYQIRYIPQISATQDGALIYVPVTDPADSFIYTGERAQIVRAMGYEGAIQANCYDPVVIAIPGLEAIDEPLFTQTGAEARLEQSTLLYVMAQSSYTGTAASLTLGWLKLDYRVRFYNPVASPIEDGFYSSSLFTTGAWATVFNTALPAPDQVLQGNPGFWFPSGAPDTGYYSCVLTGDWLGDGAVITTFTTTHDSFTLVKGSVLWYALDNNGGGLNVHFYLCPEDAIAHDNPLRITAPAAATNATINCDIVFFDTNQGI